MLSGPRVGNPWYATAAAAAAAVRPVSRLDSSPPRLMATLAGGPPDVRAELPVDRLQLLAEIVLQQGLRGGRVPAAAGVVGPGQSATQRPLDAARRRVVQQSLEPGPVAAALAVPEEPGEGPRLRVER